MNKRVSYLIIAIFTVFAGSSCDRDKNNPGYDYFPDMYYSRAYETYDPNPVFADSQTLQLPVAGTISQEQELYPYDRSEEGMLSAVSIVNPIKPDTAVLSRGKIVYQTKCSHCHGENADGQGILFTSGKYPFPPANLLGEKVVNRTDGQMYHTITVGYGIMEPHDIIVRPDDRWKVILYIRSLQANTQ